MIRAYVGKPGDTVVDDHTDNELVSIVRRDLSQMMTCKGCLLYTSDAADDGESVDLGGRRIIKKKIKD
ncbi:hypothetical protein JMUB7531_29040 [Staphylococcus aureus]